MDEHANENVDVVSFVCGDHAFSDRVLNGLGNAVLGGAEHLNGLAGVLDGDLVEHRGVGLALQVRRDDGEERREAVLVVRQRVAKCSFNSRTARSDEEVDVRHFVAVADERFADHYAIDLSHYE